MEFRCTKCGQTKTAEEMGKNKKRPGGYSSHCKACRRAYYAPRPKASRLNPGDTKRCTKCGEVKPVEEFRQSDNYRTGYVSQCKDCQRAMARSWKRRNKKRMREYQAQWNEENPDYHHVWWDALPEETRERYLTHKREFSKTPRMRAYFRDKQRERAAARVGGDISPEWMERLHAIQTHCAYCGREFCSSLQPTIEHIVPLSKGGAHTRDNVVLSCQACNSSKRDHLIGISCISPEPELRSPESLLGLL